MYEKIEFEVRGVVPLMVHNGQLADPLNEFAKAIKRISSKAGKTEADYEEMSHLEFLGGLYVSDGAIVYPGENVEAALRDAGRTVKLGSAVERGVVCDAYPPIVYSGPREPEKLWAVEREIEVEGKYMQAFAVVRKELRLESRQRSTPGLLPEAQKQSA